MIPGWCVDSTSDSQYSGTLVSRHPRDAKKGVRADWSWPWTQGIVKIQCLYGVEKRGVLWCEGGRKCPSEELPPYCAVKVMIAARSIVFKLYGVLSRSAIVITRCVKLAYRIYSINRPGRLLNFWTLRVGAYSRWALIRGWALMKFSPVSASEVCLFCNKTINANNKTRRSNKSRFL